MPFETDDQRVSFVPEQELDRADVPSGVDRRTFMMRSAVIGAAAVITGCSKSGPEQIAAAVAPPPVLPATPLSNELDVVKRSKGPVMTTLEEFYKVGPGPSSSHTIGPMRITYDFYQRCTKLPADQLAKATARSAPRSPESSGKSQQRSNRNSSTVSQRTQIRRSR